MRLNRPALARQSNPSPSVAQETDRTCLGTWRTWTPPARYMGASKKRPRPRVEVAPVTDPIDARSVRYDKLYRVHEHTYLGLRPIFPMMANTSKL